jgi:predicted alpha/beta-fold hydrolase
MQIIVQNATPMFNPCIWVPGALSHTLWNFCLRNINPLKSAEEIGQWRENYLYTLDGARLCVDTYTNIKSDDSTVIVCIPGLNGDKDAHYVNQLLHYVCIPSKINMVVFNNRSYHKSRCTSSRPWATYADVDDLHVVVDHIKTYRNIIGIGFSAGGNFLMKYMEQDGMLITAGISIGSSVSINRVVREMPIMYNVALCQFRKTMMHIQDPNVRFIQDIDRITMPSQYMNIDHYYDDKSTQMSKIQAPLIYIVAQDDFVIDVNNISTVREMMATNKHITMVMTTTGGHLGWVEGWCGNGSWLFRAIIEYICILSSK